MSFASWCAYQADVTRVHLRALTEQMLRHRIVREQQADLGRTYYAVERRVVGTSSRKPRLDELDLNFS